MGTRSASDGHNRRQKSEVRSQKSEDGRQKTGKWEPGAPATGITGDRSQKSEVGSQKTGQWEPGAPATGITGDRRQETRDRISLVSSENSSVTFAVNFIRPNELPK
ncbi:MAG: hypothetical protein DWQ47_07615 [Acidobacteria bacterium]|nr:MAG: hypothetical protein DWQ32_15715 [Acidobacteriota bacterium]REJ99211.1 MAG: hypothetical protein DWQ38_14260 [Acidobacteriota bacterium]REK16068.1 MAG: hypothetical protein DWQ43_03425 [Acidobacteriota bacterium]REK43749.1 MAG: hypothetical protein DWQ47_07615 [Acidobacteriota bacterium]